MTINIKLCLFLCFCRYKRCFIKVDRDLGDLMLALDSYLPDFQLRLFLQAKGSRSCRFSVLTVDFCLLQVVMTEHLGLGSQIVQSPLFCQVGLKKTVPILYSISINIINTSSHFQNDQVGFFLPHFRFSILRTSLESDRTNIILASNWPARLELSTYRNPRNRRSPGGGSLLVWSVCWAKKQIELDFAESTSYITKVFLTRGCSRSRKVSI